MAKRLGYYEALLWLILNDDTEWLNDENPIPSVTAAFLADIFGKDIETVTRDLKREIERQINRIG
jgi:hypothetical protein